MLTFVEMLQPSAKAVRLRYPNGKRSVIDGPFTESKEIIGGFYMVQMRSLDDALEWCHRFAKIIGEDLEIDVLLAGAAQDAAQAAQ